jgi:hypothetical protein
MQQLVLVLVRHYFLNPCLPLLLFGPLFLPQDMFLLVHVILEAGLIHLPLVFVVTVTLQHSILVNKEPITAKKHSSQ